MKKSKTQKRILTAVLLSTFCVQPTFATIYDYISESINNQTNAYVNDLNGGVYKSANGDTVNVLNGSYSGNTARIGGAIVSVVGGNLTVENTIFSDNHAKYDGGAIGSYGSLNISGSTFDGNTAQFAQSIDGSFTTAVDDSIPIGGGAIALGAVSNADVASITNTIFKNNKSGKNGGAIGTRLASDADNSEARLNISAKFQNNQAVKNGGAIYNTFYAGDKGVTIVGEFIDNVAINGDGGAIYNDGSKDKANNYGGVMTITNSIFTGNKAGDWAGAIGSYNGAKLSIDSSSFSDNIAAKTAGAVANGKNSELTISNVTFTNNHALRGDGGAIGNYGSLEINNVQFDGNTAQLLQDSEGNYTIAYDGDTKPVGGGAISLGSVSASKIATIANTIFRNNKSGVNGGAIGTRLAVNGDNSAAKLDISARFEGNEAYKNGGAIYNTFYTDNGLTDENGVAKGNGVTIVGEFVDNHARQNGGAIYNDGQIAGLNTNGGVMTILGGSKFDGNSAGGLGGAIYNTGTITLDTKNGDITFANNTDSTGKNDIFMANGSKLILSGGQNVLIGSGLSSEQSSNAVIKNDGANFVFADNAVNSYTGTYQHNAGTLVLGANVASFLDYQISSGAGAELIVDESATLSQELEVNGNDTQPVTNLANVQFNGDITPTGSSIAQAIESGVFTYNGTEVNINGAGLTLGNNTIIDEYLNINGSVAVGGVRYLGFADGSGVSGNISLGADTGLQYKDGAYINNDSTLTMGSGSSLVFNNDSTTIDYDVTINATTDANIVMNGEGTTNISSALNENINIQSNSGVLNLTQAELEVGDLSVSGEDTTLNLLGNVSGGDVSVDKATLGVFGESTLGSLSLGSTLNMQNGTINNLNVGSFALNADSNLAFDVDPNTGLTDTINANTFTNTNDSSLFVTGITFTQTPTSGSFNIDLDKVLSATNGDTDGVIKVEGSIVANSEMGRYLISSSGSANALNAILTDINPQMYRGQVATIASWQNQLVVNNMLFDHMSVLGRQLMGDAKTANLKAAAYPQFAPYQYSVKDGSLWYKAYGNFERLSMTKGLSVGNNAYGSLIGADFPQINLKNGWNLIPTAYVGYNGAHQHFNGVSMYQNGAQLGFMGTAYKDDFITSLLAYAGGYANDMKVSGFNDTTGNWFAGVASKSAYNFHLTKDLIFQPTAMIAYNAFGGQNWGSNFGAMSMSSGMLNGINAAPGFNLIWNKKTFSLYATAQMVYNIMGGVDGQAGNVDTGYVRMRHSYFEYGIGAMKQFKDRFNGYLQVTLRNGGRTGIGFQGGIQIKIGK